MKTVLTFEILILSWSTSRSVAFLHHGIRPMSRLCELQMVGLFGGAATANIPSSSADRDNQAIQAVKGALAKPKSRSFPLVECEFPPLTALNKLGDGSLQSANKVDEANLAFATKLSKALSPLLGPKAWLLLSSSATNSLSQKAGKAYSRIHSLKDGLPKYNKNEICVLVAPTGRDYSIAQQLARDGCAVVLVNGFAKDNKSVPGEATMAYFLKPLTYNSNVSGYLVRVFPSKWTTIDAATKAILGTFDDKEILVPGTNTPDLRTAVRQVQKSVDERAIRARQR